MIATVRPAVCHVAIPTEIKTLFELRCYAHEVGHTSGCLQERTDEDVFLLDLDRTWPTEGDAYRFEILFLDKLSGLCPDLPSPAACQRKLYLGRYLKFVGDCIRLKVALRFFSGGTLDDLAEVYADAMRVVAPECESPHRMAFLPRCGIPTSFYQVAYLEAFLDHYLPLAARRWD